MSRIGKKPVAPVQGVEITIDGQTVTAKGPKGQLSVELMDRVKPELSSEGLTVAPFDNSREARAAWGISRTLIQNIVTGVSQGFERKLAISGVGYRAQMQGSDLKLLLGFSHEVIFKAPDGIQLAAPSQTEIIVTGIDKQKVGQVAADIREFRPPEPYKGKGVRYADEYVVRKEGKKK